MTQNEIDFAKSVVDFKANVVKAQAYIKENYGIDSDFEKETSTLHLKAGLNETLEAAQAKDYVYQQISESMIQVEYGF